MLVNRITAFLFGASLASAITVLLSSHSPTAPIEDKIEHWQARARKAEQELAVLHARLQSEAAQNPTISPPSPVMAPATSSYAPPGSVASPSSPPPPDLDSTSDAIRNEQWDALVSRALEHEVERRLGRKLDPERMERLLGTLRRLRDASVGLGQEPLDPHDPESLRDHLARTLVLVESDRLFREELGIGFSDFLRGLDGDPVEEVHPAKPGESAR
ncbi:conserved exported protein of unknown function [Methylocaldum szegediense]|uniref:Uncharacterized protein n=1 Tax=Methylocaldum szegediense TaxID=73780 RepID=A0ABM9I4T7_9GAMM|nr:conserved exported protein of unknown function [Methylocaldum szegediense]